MSSNSDTSSVSTPVAVILVVAVTVVLAGLAFVAVFDMASLHEEARAGADVNAQNPSETGRLSRR
jgi:FlaG/FlaF family flagellin (archaellin)